MRFKSKTAPSVSVKGPSGRIYCFSGTEATVVVDGRDIQAFLKRSDLVNMDRSLAVRGPEKTAEHDEPVAVVTTPADVVEKKPEPAPEPPPAPEPEEKVEESTEEAPADSKEESSEEDEKSVISTRRKRSKRGSR